MVRFWFWGRACESGDWGVSEFRCRYSAGTAQHSAPSLPCKCSDEQVGEQLLVQSSCNGLFSDLEELSQRAVFETLGW